jgi:hypothetical protein
MARRFAGLMLMRIIGETHSTVKKIQQKQGREIVHLDKPVLRKQSILKTPFSKSNLLGAQGSPLGALFTWRGGSPVLA